MPNTIIIDGTFMNTGTFSMEPIPQINIIARLIIVPIIPERSIVGIIYKKNIVPAAVRRLKLGMAV